MNLQRAIGCLLVVFFGILSSPGSTQVNLKAGYNLSFLTDPELDRVISIRNQISGYSSPLSNLKWLHGFEAGLRFRSQMHAIELSYQNSYQSLKAEGTGNNNNETYTDKIRIGIQSGAFGYQVSSERFGIGVDLQHQWYRSRVELGETTSSHRDHQKMWGLKYYMMLTLPGNNGIDVALQPYYAMPLKAYDINIIKSHLYESGPVPIRKWNRFGLTILFYNGPK